MLKQKISPREHIHQQVDELPDNGIDGHQGNLLGALVRLGAQRIVLEALKEETTRLRDATQLQADLSSPAAQLPI
jgi:hypothetical protein